MPSWAKQTIAVPAPIGNRTITLTISKGVCVLDNDERARFLGIIDQKTMGGSRLYAMCLFILHNGMRASEVCGILWKNTNLDGDPPTVRTRVKGGEYVTFELTEQATEAIRDYLRITKRNPENDDALFCPVTQRKKDGKVKQPLDPYYLWKQIKIIGKSISLEWINPQILRRTHFRDLVPNIWDRTPPIAKSGIFYMVQLNPIHIPGRVKLGWTKGDYKNTRSRFDPMRGICPRMLVLREWVCTKENEITAIEYIGAIAEHIGGSVYDFENTNVAIQRAQKFFAVKRE